MSQTLEIAAIQANLFWEDPAANRAYFDERLAAIKKEVELIILPEMFATGFSMNPDGIADAGETLNWMRTKAAELKSAIAGSLMVKENDLHYNRFYFVTPGGSVTAYDKRHTFTLAKEHLTYTSGSKRLIIEYKGWKICPLICYDLRFPVWARNTENYDLLLYVANWPKTRVNAWDALLKARAIENMSYCIGVNRTGKDGDGYEYNGHTAVYDCLGILKSSEDFEDSFLQEIQLSKKHLQETRAKLRFLEDRDAFILK